MTRNNHFSSSSSTNEIPGRLTFLLLPKNHHRSFSLLPRFLAPSLYPPSLPSPIDFAIRAMKSVKEEGGAILCGWFFFSVSSSSAKEDFCSRTATLAQCHKPREREWKVVQQNSDRAIWSVSADGQLPQTDLLAQPTEKRDKMGCTVHVMRHPLIQAEV